MARRAAGGPPRSSPLLTLGHPRREARLRPSAKALSVEVKEAHVFHMRDGKVMEFWNASADQYAFDELIG